MPHRSETAPSEAVPRTWPRSRRLQKRPEFLRAYDTGCRRSSPHFTVFGLPRPRPAEAGLEPARFGITVSRKLGDAVTRNRIRRRTRELLRLMAKDAAAGCDVVVNPRRSVLGAPWPVLVGEMRELLRRLPAGGEAGS